MPGSVAPLDLEGVTVPYHFRCPISLELMRDPVTVCTGQTYDRPSIESWVATGNTTCPVTRTPLTDFTLIPNHTLRRLIQEWCVAHRSLGVERIPTPKQPADPSLVQLLVSQASAGEPGTRAAALRRLRSLARESDKNRAVISTHETRSALIEIAFEDPDPDLGLEAMGVLAMCSLTEGESAEVAGRPERLRRLVEVMREHPAMEARISAAAVLEAVAAGARSAEARAAVGATEGVMEGLVGLLEEKGSSARAVRAGIRGLFSLCLAKENRGRAVAAGAAAAVVGRIGELAAERGDAERALATVELLCRTEGGREAVVAGVVTQLLLMVQGGCSDRAKRKAQLLLKLLRSAWPHHDSIANSDDFLQPF
ncbi:U-box domain-containing protein 25 [Cocos nucifera]|uniref:U-box domain-containing protein n=1 Tax=Cocos nucifera TaxID=13894 RepID=A0A8K0I080_COCNU|nr:U-box domain-containing protein 25 [Cocos nucifera]